MMRLAILDYIKDYPNVALITDKRSVKVASGNSMADYLQITLMTEYNSDTRLTDLPFDSKNSLNVQFIDFIANIVWRSYELKDKVAMGILSRYIHSRALFPHRT